MSTLMKGFNIPKHSGDTNIPELHKACIKVYSNGSAELVLMKTKEHYPLVEVPTPHGDLIDRNKIDYCDYDIENSRTFVSMTAAEKEWIDEMPAIIKAED